MNAAQIATDKKVRGQAANMNRDEGLKMLELMLERSTVAEIVNAIEMAKLSDEVKQISRQLSKF